MHMAEDVETGNWTLAELHRLPDDGNKYELVHGELFVTPAPSPAHDEISAALHRILSPYVEAHGLGHVYTPRSVFRSHGSEVEPDLMVRPRLRVSEKWEDQPRPILVVEILSGTTRRRDLGPKRAFYVEEGIPEYWVVDRLERTVRVVRPGHDDAVEAGTLTWHPAGAAEPLVIDLPALFREALG